MSIRYRLAHYEITDELGHGGMGVVYRARDTLLGRTLAIKVLPTLMQSDPERRGRFLREARAAAALNHPSIATVYEVGEAQLETVAPVGEEGDQEVTRTSPTTCLYIAMEYVPGDDLDKFLSAEPMAVEETLKLAVQMADALDVAHDAGVIHRDLKPRNIRVTPEGRVKILDFGLAKVLREGAGLESALGGTVEAVRTMDGMIVGTVPYMAPEQVEGKDVDARSDLFALGVVLYQMLTGHVPFDGSGLVQYVRALSAGRPKPIRSHNPAVPAELEAIITRLLARESGERYATAGGVVQALRDVLGSAEVSFVTTGVRQVSADGQAGHQSGRRWRLVALSLFALAGLFALGFALRSDRAGVADRHDTIHISSFGGSDGGNVPSWCASAEVNVRRDLLASDESLVILTGQQGPEGARITIRGECQEIEGTQQLYVVVEHGATGEVVWDQILKPRGGIGDGAAQELSFLLSRTLRTLKEFEQLPNRTTSEKTAAARLHLQGVHRLEAALEPSDVQGVLANLEASLEISGSMAATHARISEAIYWAWRAIGEDAEERFRSAVQAALDAAPDDPQSLLAESRRLELDGLHADAARMALAVVTEHPELAQAHQQAGWRLRRDGQLEESRDAFLKAVRLRPGFWRYWNDLATLLKNSFGEQARAQEAFRTAVELSPEGVIWLIENLASVALYLGDLDEAERHLASVPEHRHTGSFANARGRLNFYRSRWDAAAFDFRRATRMEPANVVFRANLGDAEWKGGDRDKARQTYGAVAAELKQQVERLPEGNVSRKAYLQAKRSSMLARVARCEEALVELQIARQSLPRSRRTSFGWFSLAETMCLCGTQAQAVELVFEAVQLGGINGLDLATSVGCEDHVSSEAFTKVIAVATTRESD